jgi:hypothetical protein
MADVVERGWKRRFDQPIPPPRGRQLVTLQDAGNYITKLRKAEHEAPEWQAAMKALILVAENNGPTMFARIGVMQVLNRHHVREFDLDGKPHHWGKRKLKRDQ